jgi:hypothetical protein
MKPFAAALAVLALATAQAALAQPPDTSRQALYVEEEDLWEPAASPQRHVSFNLVQVLNLSDAQTVQLAQIFKEWSAKLDAEKSSGQTRRSSQRRAEQVWREEERQLKTVLTPAQLTKFRNFLGAIRLHSQPEVPWVGVGIATRGVARGYQ